MSSGAHLLFLEEAVQTGGLACAGSTRNIEAGGFVRHHMVLQEGDDGSSLGLTREKTFRYCSVKSLLYTLITRFCRKRDHKNTDSLLNVSN